MTAVEAELVGSTLPRLYTPPLEGRERGNGCVPGCECGLTAETSHGFDVIDWAKLTLLIDLHPWQKWLLVHALELDEQLDQYRHRVVLTLVARQNGKTLVKSVLTLWRMFEAGDKYLIGTAQDLSQAREVMNETLVPILLECPEHEYRDPFCPRCRLRRRFDPDAENTDDRRGQWHKTLNDEYFRLDSRWHGGRVVGPHGPRYMIKALNRRAGRGLSGVAEVNIDELREQRDFQGWAAISKTALANPNAQIWCMSNMGDSESLLLNHLRGVALSGADSSMFHAEWSAEPNCELDDPVAWCQANPSLGYSLTEGAIRSALATDPPSVFRTEVLCQSVDIYSTAIDTAAWSTLADPAGSMPDDRMVMCVESSLEGDSVVAVGAVMLPDGRARLDVVGVWGSTEEARAALPELKAALRPRILVWFPKGPSAGALGPVLRRLGAREIKGTAVSEACMTLADRVDGRQVTHGDHPVLSAQVGHTGMVGNAASWIFDRGPGATNAVWAAAGALHALLNSPAPMHRERRVLLPDLSGVA